MEIPDAVILRLRSENNRSGTLVLSDIDYPGWRAVVDGEDAEILRFNYVLRCVSLDAGAHEIEFRFEPASYRLGRILALASAVLLAVYVTGVPKRRSSPK